VYGNYVMKKLGRPPAMNPARHLKIDFDVFEYGIYKRRLVEGDPEDCDDWTTGHPILFPNILAQGDHGRMNFQIRVPVDDEHTQEVRYIGVPRKPGAAPREQIPVRHLTPFNPDGRIVADQINKQDWLAWIAQGPISDRTTEHLVTSDKGILLYRKVLLENIARVERGEDPMGVIRDPEVNEPMISIRRERTGYTQFWTMDGEERRPDRVIAR
jgi:5,5'-dehydrodivanillate O-demethylase